MGRYGSANVDESEDGSLRRALRKAEGATFWDRHAGLLAAGTCALACVMAVTTCSLAVSLNSAKQDLAVVKYSVAGSPYAVRPTEEAAVVNPMSVTFPANPTFYSTGVNADGSSLNAGDEDPHWFDAGGKPCTVMERNLAWMVPPNGAMWVNTQGKDRGATALKPGITTATTTFYITRSSTQIILEYGGDDVVLSVEMNGYKNENCAQAHYSIATSCIFTSTSNVLVLGGANTLTITLQNLGGEDSPSGFWVSGMEIRYTLAEEFVSTGTALEGQALAFGDNDPHWFDYEREVPAIVTKPNGAWLDDNQQGMWVSSVADSSKENAPGDYVYATFFDVVSYDCVVGMNVAVDSKVTKMNLNGVDITAKVATFDKTTGFQLTKENGLQPGSNLLKVYWTNPDGVGGLYVSGSTECSNVDNTPSIVGGTVSKDTVYEKQCMFTVGPGYYSCGGCDSNDFTKDMTIMQTMLDENVQMCESDFKVRTQYLTYCSEDDAEQALDQCRQYWNGVFDSMWSCTALGVDGGVPQFKYNYAIQTKQSVGLMEDYAAEQSKEMEEQNEKMKDEIDELYGVPDEAPQANVTFPDQEVTPTPVP